MADNIQARKTFFATGPNVIMFELLLTVVLGSEKKKQLFSPVDSHCNKKFPPLKFLESINFLETAYE